MNLFTVYSEKEMRFLASLPKLIKKKEIAIESINIFNNLNEEELKIVNKKEITLKKGDLYKTNKIIWVAKGSVGILKLRDIVKKISSNEVFGTKEFLNKKDYQFIALKDSVLLEIDLSLTPSTALCKILLNLCQTEK